MQVREAEREHDKRANPTPPCPDQNILHHLSSLVHSARRLAVLCSTWRIMQNRSCSSQNPFLPRSEHTSAFLLTWQSAVVVPSFRIMAKPQLYQHPFLPQLLCGGNTNHKKEGLSHYKPRSQVLVIFHNIRNS